MINLKDISMDTQKLKTTSIISYGLVPLIKLGGEDSLFKLWQESEKEKLEEAKDKKMLGDYVKFCAYEINLFLSALKCVVPKEKWTTDKKIQGRLLTTTHINGFVICLRHMVENGKTGYF